MKPDFDSFEFAGLIAPGGVVVLALAFLYGARTPTIDSLLGTILLVTAAYVVGHLVAALANISEKFHLGTFKLWPPDLDLLDEAAWIERKYLVASQSERLNHFLRTKLGCSALGEDDELRMVVKQMKINVLGGAGGQRVESFNGLFNLSRGLTVSFFIAGLLCAFSGRYVAVFACAVACGLARYRCRKFRNTYAKELIQQFLSLETTEIERAYSLGTKVKTRTHS